MGERRVDEGGAAYRRALERIEREQPRYERLLRTVVLDAAADTVQSLCSRLLGFELPAQGISLGQRDAFFTWAFSNSSSPIFWVLAAEHELARSCSGRAYELARHAVSMNSKDLHAQELMQRARSSSSAKVEGDSIDLAGRFCRVPFEELDFQADGNAHTCCPAWLPVPIGRYEGQTPEEIWNSQQAQEIRRSILDGDFRYCSRVHCPMITSRTLPRRDEVKDEYLKEIIAEHRTRMDRRPRHVLLSNDRSCNLTCPSCRRDQFMANKSQIEHLNQVAEHTLLPLMKGAVSAKITGSRDPFASGHYRYIMRRINREEFPNLQIILQTNGVLLDEETWRDFDLDGKVRAIWVSIDAARAETYAVLRRGGDFDRLLRNFVFMKGLREGKEIEELRLDVVVQASNFRELPAVVQIGRVYGFDRVRLSMIRNWSTFSPEEFKRVDIGSPAHPEFGDFVEILRHPSLKPGFVYHGNVRPFWEEANSASAIAFQE